MFWFLPLLSSISAGFNPEKSELNAATELTYLPSSHLKLEGYLRAVTSLHTSAVSLENCSLWSNLADYLFTNVILLLR